MDVFKMIAHKFCGRYNTKSFDEIIIRKNISHMMLNIEYMNIEYCITQNNHEMLSVKINTVFCIESFVTDYVFPVFFIIHDGQQYSVQLQSKSHTYYIVGNNIDKNFVASYLGLNYNEIKHYTINFVDNNLKSITITEHDTLVLYKTMYKII